MDNCISDFELLGCAKGAVEVGSWFVPVGAAAHGAEIAAEAGAHLLEGAAAAEGRTIVATGAEELATAGDGGYPYVARKVGS
ncbi:MULTISPECIES: hypothetical protein [unclassified Amycolatopsis]|uniref:hypothetical protein n=1 Tax=unclassified Amycolatopsis TaxID=2618356 RepID=UPI001C6A41D5|nr:hypothetical protein [Amycolatopsis sp. DSM 110486]QYN19225.1 hypothetical protein K1T34_42395 [Amycolatopsis sp. DSM 110486]